jgi:hypothetical protein
MRVTWHVRIPATTNSHVKRRPGPARISQSLAESHLFDEAFRSVNVLNAVLRIASPHPIAMDLDLFRNHGAILSK